MLPFEHDISVYFSFYLSISSGWNREPNDYKGQEDCGVLKSNGYYNDVSCTVTKAAAICELDNIRK